MESPLRLRRSPEIVNSRFCFTFKYDPFGRRIEKISPNATSIFAYDADNLVETMNATGGLVAHYTQGQNIDEPLAMQRGATTDYYEADGLGSITSLTASNGTVAQSYTYDSFGNTTNSSGSLRNYFQYTGREFDTETDLYFDRARYFDPTTGRFLSEDPIGFSGDGTNFYAYVENDPGNSIDPFGLQGRKPWHPPGLYNRIRCTKRDPCPVLLSKIEAFAYTIASHSLVDWLAGDTYHTDKGEIPAFWRGYERCVQIYMEKCNGNCPDQNPQPAPNPSPNPAPGPVPMPFLPLLSPSPGQLPVLPEPYIPTPGPILFPEPILILE